jgi:hypothetical protein
VRIQRLEFAMSAPCHAHGPRTGSWLVITVTPDKAQAQNNAEISWLGQSGTTASIRLKSSAMGDACGADEGLRRSTFAAANDDTDPGTDLLIFRGLA